MTNINVPWNHGKGQKKCIHPNSQLNSNSLFGYILLHSKSIKSRKISQGFKKYQITKPRRAQTENQFFIILIKLDKKRVYLADIKLVIS